MLVFASNSINRNQLSLLIPKYKKGSNTDAIHFWIWVVFSVRLSINQIIFFIATKLAETNKLYPYERKNEEEIYIIDFTSWVFWNIFFWNHIP